MTTSFNISVLISGGGTTLKNLLDIRSAGSLEATVVQVVSSNPNAGGNQFAIDHDLPLEILQRNSFASDAEFSESVFEKIRAANVDLVVMGGFLKKLVIPPDFENRVINIHPSLIPAFSGKGFYGSRVHQAVVNYGCKLTGCTVHFVDNEYDHGPIIAQRSVPVQPDDDAGMLQKRVFDVECELYPAVINSIARGQIELDDRLVVGF